MSATNNNRKHESSTDGISSQRLNLILAVCGIVIALASFYATYLQAEAADKQVKAMTMPLIQFRHGNTDNDLETQIISFTLGNAGIGPALIKSVVYKYKGQSYYSLSRFLTLCCTSKQELQQDQTPINIRSTTSTLIDTILAGQTEQRFLSIYRSNNDVDYWDKLDKARWQLNVEICYCSMLDECYITEKNGVIESIEQCPILDKDIQ